MSSVHPLAQCVRWLTQNDLRWASSLPSPPCLRFHILSRTRTSRNASSSVGVATTLRKWSGSVSDSLRYRKAKNGMAPWPHLHTAKLPIPLLLTCLYSLAVLLGSRHRLVPLTRRCRARQLREPCRARLRALVLVLVVAVWLCHSRAPVLLVHDIRCAR